MAGKYQKLRGKLEVFVPENQEKINEFKQKIIDADDHVAGLNIRKIAVLFAATRKVKSDLEGKLSAINVEMSGLSQIIVDHLETESVQKIELSTGELIYLQDTPYPSVVDKEALFAWIKKEKLVNLLTAHHQMLKGMCGELLIKGKRLPPGVAVFMKTEARVRAGKEDEDGE